MTEQLAEARNILASRWQSLSDQQRADFVQELKQFDIKTARPQPNVLIFPDFTHHDAVELSHTMSWLFAQADWNAPTLSSGRNPVDCPPGITIHATAERLGLQAITKALGRVNIPYELKPEVIREAIAMYIGRRNP